MLEAVLIGFGLGFSLAAPPGPVLAQLATETARGRPWKGLRVGLGATSADATFFLLTYYGVLHVLPGRRVLAAMALAGALLMLYFARGAWRAARRPLDLQAGARVSGFPGGFLLAALSPFNIAWWLTTGAAMLALYGATLASGFFLAILLVVVVSVLLVGWGARRIARFETYVSYASAVFLAGFAVFLVVHGTTMLV